jgi:DNA-binding NtrC family response regulator
MARINYRIFVESESAGMDSKDKKRVLIVDDDQSVLFVLYHTIARLGDEYEIVTAATAEEAWECFDENDFDLIITDLRLPGKSGIDFTEHVREKDGDVPVIWITAYGGSETPNKAAELSVCSYMNKPLEIGEIRKKAREALGVSA